MSSIKDPIEYVAQAANRLERSLLQFDEHLSESAPDLLRLIGKLAEALTPEQVLALPAETLSWMRVAVSALDARYPTSKEKEFSNV